MIHRHGVLWKRRRHTDWHIETEAEAGRQWSRQTEWRGPEIWKETRKQHPIICRRCLNHKKPYAMTCEGHYQPTHTCIRNRANESPHKENSVQSRNRRLYRRRPTWFQKGKAHKRCNWSITDVGVKKYLCTLCTLCRSRRGLRQSRLKEIARQFD